LDWVRGRRRGASCRCKFISKSCAISNFPEENTPDALYIDAIRRDMSAAWREFALSVNDALLEKSV
jgi:monoamine oxidase